MGKVIVTTFVSLDGIMEQPMWTFPYWNDEIAQFKDAEMDKGMDAHLLGRVSYQEFASVWPNQPDAPGADMMNNKPKHVVSTTLETADWQPATIIRGNLPEEVAKLKSQYEKDIIVSGSATLVNSLAKLNLVDEYHLLVYPVVIGKGKRLFQENTDLKLKLVESKTFSSGVVLMIYHPDNEAS
jgi:dihydrofolate reductase